MTKARLTRDVMPEREDDNVSTEAMGIDYSQAGLEALKKSQLNRSLRTRADTHMDLDIDSAPPAPVVVENPIPDAASIFAARKLREQKRNEAADIGAGALVGIASKGRDLYISLDGRDGDDAENGVGGPKMESRLVSEEQEGEGQESFEDYEGDTITFGSRAVKEAEAKRKEQFQTQLIEAYASRQSKIGFSYSFQSRVGSG